MHSRPVNAIFYHPKHKFIVVYQNGTLWQLPRMKIDVESWRRREPYQGDNTELFLYRHQHIADDELAHLLPTHNFPDNLTNNSITLFESWWLNHSYEWLKNQENNGNSQGSENRKTATASTNRKNNATQTKRKPVASAQAKKAPAKSTAVKKTATKKQAVKTEAVEIKKQTQTQQVQKTPQSKQNSTQKPTQQSVSPKSAKQVKKATDESIKPSDNQQETASKKPSTPTATTNSEDIFEDLLNHWDDL